MFHKMYQLYKFKSLLNFKLIKVIGFVERSVARKTVND
jgi:hypothetical protein